MKKMTIILLAALMALVFNGQVIAGNELQNQRGSTFHGFVEKIPVGLYGTWVISGRSILVTPYSRVEQDHGLGTVGSYAEIRGRIKGQTFHATTVQIEPGGKFLVDELPDHKHQNGRFLGMINDLPHARIGYWKIDGHSVLVDKMSRIVEAQGRAVAGALASVVGYYRNNTFYADLIEVK